MPTTQNTEGGRSEVQGHRWLVGKFEVSLGKVRSSQKKKKSKTKTPKNNDKTSKS